jgi:hypothetical protein
MKTVRDVDATRFERTEARLFQWGAACKQKGDDLGTRSSSGLRMAISTEQDKYEKQKLARRQQIRNLRRLLESQNVAIDPKLVAEQLRYAEQQLTAMGRQSPNFAGKHFQLDSRDLVVDKVVSKLPRWARLCIKRSYMDLLSDREAAKLLKMRCGEYAQRKRAAVELVQLKLDGNR